MIEEKQVWRIDCSESVASVTVWRSVHGVWTTGDGFLGVTPWLAVLSYALRHAIIGTILAPGEPTRAELLAERDAAREDYAAAVEYLAGIVRAWQRASDEDRRMADVFVSGLRREIEEARGSARASGGRRLDEHGP